jgi:type 1 glutamine amidotransferase
MSGGWEGHQPHKVAAILTDYLLSLDFCVVNEVDLACLEDAASLTDFDLIVPNWTMGVLSNEAQKNLCAAVREGVGLAGCHGGMGDAFRASTDYQFMVGGQFVAHPGNDGVEYQVRVTNRDHKITRGVADFAVRSEQYYMHVDPANHVLAVTEFPTADGPHVPNGMVEMPVVWTKQYGLGKVFYCALGHIPDVLELEPVRRLMMQGFEWAARD